MSKTVNSNKVDSTGPENGFTRRELLMRLSPLGKVTVEKDRCTGCGLCAAGCDTGALSVSVDAEAGAFKLLFRHGSCNACGRCAEVCPEKCLTVARTFEPSDLNGPGTVLFQDDVVRCSVCGSPFSTRAMINHVRARLRTASTAPRQLDICPVCKAGIYSERTVK